MFSLGSHISVDNSQQEETNRNIQASQKADSKCCEIKAAAET
jgi:hypothetical protein